MDAPIGEAIRVARKAAGLTLDDVAVRVGVTAGALSHIESGRRLPSAQNAVLIAEVLDIAADEMLRALDVEHSTRRETQAYSARRDQGVLHSQSARSPRRAYSRHAIEDLFDQASPAPAAPAAMGSGTGSTRNKARRAENTAERLEALDVLADTAAETIRTLRGLLGDEDPVVAREARRLLRELDVHLPEE